MDANQPPLFQRSRGGGRPSWRIPKEQFASDTLEAIARLRSDATRHRVADALGMDVSTFDRYRSHYDVFRDWQATVNAVLAGVTASRAKDPPAVGHEPTEIHYWMEIVEGDDGVQRIDGVDPAYAQLIGRGADDLVGMTSLEATGHAPVPELIRISRDVMASGTPPPGRQLQWVVHHRTGELLWFVTMFTRIDARHFRVRLEPIIDASSVRHFTALANIRTADLLTLTVDRLGIIVAANKATRHALGYSKSELVDSNVEAMLKPGMPSELHARPRLVAMLRHMRETGDPVEVEFEEAWQAKNGEWLLVLLRMSWAAGAEAWTTRGVVMGRTREVPTFPDLPLEPTPLKAADQAVVWLEPDPATSDHAAALRRTVTRIVGPGRFGIGPPLAASFMVVELCRYAHMLGLHHFDALHIVTQGIT